MNEFRQVHPGGDASITMKLLYVTFRRGQAVGKSTFGHFHVDVSFRTFVAQILDKALLCLNTYPVFDISKFSGFDPPFDGFGIRLCDTNSVFMAVSQLELDVVIPIFLFCGLFTHYSEEGFERIINQADLTARVVKREGPSSYRVFNNKIR